MDSNHDKGLQRALCYRYTIGQSEAKLARTRRAANKIRIGLFLTGAGQIYSSDGTPLSCSLPASSFAKATEDRGGERGKASGGYRIT